MAKYKKVKRYHRSFYSPGMWVKKAVGIIVLVAVVLDEYGGMVGIVTLLRAAAR